MRFPSILAATMLAALALAPPGAAAPLPNPECEPRQDVHAYVGVGTLNLFGLAVGTAPTFDGAEDCPLDCEEDPSWPECDLCALLEPQEIVRCCPGSGPVNATALCPSDGEHEFGVGAGFLRADHHNATVHVRDDVLPEVTFDVGSDGDGNGVIDRSDPDDCLQTFRGSGTTRCRPGADGGWWVFIVGSVGQGGLVSPAVGGEIFTG